MLKPSNILTIAGLALALAAPQALAQTKKKPAPVAQAPASSAGIGEGDTEINFFGSLQDHDAGITSLVLGVGFGKYVSDNLQLKITQTLIFADADVAGTSASAFIYSPYVSGEYQIRPNPSSPFVGFVGGGLGMQVGTIDAGGSDFFLYSLYLAPTGGVKYFLNERTSLTYTLTYQFPLVEEFCDDIDCYDSETTTLSNTLGFSIYY